MNDLSEHNNSLREQYSSHLKDKSIQIIDSPVDLDSIDEVIRNCLSIEDMREAGTFFTGDELALTAVEGLQNPITKKSIILDPTCGAGNLLIASSRQLTTTRKLSTTLKSWGKSLYGYDLFPVFIELTKLRIIFEAVSRGAKADCSLDTAFELLSNITIKDAMSAESSDVNNVTHIISNPPFSLWPSPKRDFWKAGKVNAAAVIFEHYLKILPEGCAISAILPEVLRSGSRYNDWRGFCQAYSTAQVNIVGKFNTKTDVDVFTFQGIKKNNLSSIDWMTLDAELGTTISEHFDISVGRLVAYRDPLEGPDYPYIHPRNVPLWQKVTQF